LADGSGWVSNTGDGTVTRFDPVTGHVRATVRVPGGTIAALLATPSATWVSVYDGSALVRIDPATDRVAGTLAVGQQPQNLAAVGSQIWLARGGEDDVALVRS
ncbi:MAG TPA: hypothetical protein VGJ28_17115, partial [Micromonosporaceae bacterium]